MKFLILSENSNGAWPYLYVRSLGPYELKRRAELAGHHADILEWFTYWDKNTLKNVITNFFKTSTENVIALSTPFTLIDVYEIKDVLIWAKETIPNLKIIHGGSRTVDYSLSNIIDVFFLGRSMQMFEDWMNKQPLTDYIYSENPLVLVNNNINQSIENPVCVNFSDNDFLTKRDIVGFEIGLGCKFNCTFCNYELRNSKVTTLLDVYQLQNFFSETYNKYGVENYYVADDTINESDQKLEIIAEALSGLKFHPKISAFARLDIIAAKKSQQVLLEKIKFKSLFFGIESFNNEASKLIRKKSGIENFYETLKQLKKTCPETFTVGGIIVGLNNDSEKSIYESVNKILTDKLLDGLEFYPLHIYVPNQAFKDDFLSDLAKDPEKHGYKIGSTIDFFKKNKRVNNLEWKSNWTDSVNSQNLSLQLKEYCKSKGLYEIGHLEYASMYSMGVINSDFKKVDQDAFRNKAYAISRLLKEQYINKKLTYLLL